MQNLMFHMQTSPGSIRYAGRRLGQDNETFYSQELGLSPQRIAELNDKGVL
jgi:crotonobetainyl-CoA:carnitine CoA-transferase CaiB-like acyl-CoA transferase